MGKIKKVNINGKEVMPFTIPSGIVMTDVRCAKRLLEKIPELGVWTTKSIGVKERVVPERYEVEHPLPDKEYGFREPIITQLDSGTFVNAVRLVNPGKDKFKDQLLEAKLPTNRVINCSVFGGSIEEIVSVIDTVNDVVDIREINGSCPHSEKGGMLIGTDPKLVYDYTKAGVQAARGRPVIFKLTPNTDKIGLLAKAAKEAGAIGVSLINTVGPQKVYFEDQPVLYSPMGGGISGDAVRERGLECLREVRSAVGSDFLVFMMGGIKRASDARVAFANGASVVGIGTGLVGMIEFGIKNYFSELVKDIENGTSNADRLLRTVDMSYRKVKITRIENQNCNYKIFRTDTVMKAEPGQFVFAMLPGNRMPNGKPGEKPFSVMDDEPLTLGVMERGYFTEQFNSLKEGDYFYVRGPYGQEVEVKYGSDVVLVGGGCGIAGLNLLAKRFSEVANVVSLLAAKDRQHLGDLSSFEKYGQVHVATEDGSLGIKGTALDLMRKVDIGDYFFNCGPRAMIDAVLPLQRSFAEPENIYSSLDYITRCGIGICGSCVDKKGRRTCVEGPFMNA